MEKTGSVIEFLYNADGIRTSKTVNNVKHDYTLNGSQIVSEAWSGTLFVYLYDESGSPIGIQYRYDSYAAGTFNTFYFEKNLQGDIVAIYTESGEKVLSYTYDAWGNHTTTWHNTSGANLLALYNPFRYRGYYYDIETGLYYLQSRYYNPAWGRFLNADGYVNANGDLIGFNMYAYCSNNPVMCVDPFGNEAGVLYGLAALLPFVDGPIPIGDIIAGLLIVGMMVIADPVPVIQVNTPPVIETFQEEFTSIPVDSVPNTGHLPLPQEKGSNIIADPADIVSVPTIVTSKGDIKKHGLPTQGKIRYIPPKGGVKTAPGGKFIDKFGNVWQPGPSRTAGEAFEWDVQLSRQGRAQLGWVSRDGKHLNISLKGRITHK